MKISNNVVKSMMAKIKVILGNDTKLQLTFGKSNVEGTVIRNNGLIRCEALVREGSQAVSYNFAVEDDSLTETQVVCVNAKSAINAFSLLMGEEIELSLTENKVNLKAGKAKSSLEVFSDTIEDLVKPSEARPAAVMQIAVNGEDLSLLFEKGGYAAAKDSSRDMDKIILVEDDNRLKMISTDGHIVGKATTEEVSFLSEASIREQLEDIEVSSEEEQAMLALAQTIANNRHEVYGEGNVTVGIPLSNFANLVTIVGDDDTNIVVTKNYLIAKTGDSLYYTKLSANYMNPEMIEQQLQNLNNLGSLCVAGNDFSKAVNFVKNIDTSEKKSFSMTVDGEELILTTKNGDSYSVHIKGISNMDGMTEKFFDSSLFSKVVGTLENGNIVLCVSATGNSPAYVINGDLDSDTREKAISMVLPLVSFV